MFSTFFHHTYPYLCGQWFLKLVTYLMILHIVGSAYMLGFIGFFLKNTVVKMLLADVSIEDVSIRRNGRARGK